MDVMYTLNKLGFTVNDDTESMDLLYWYAAYQKDKQKADEEKRRASNRVKLR